MSRFPVRLCSFLLLPAFALVLNSAAGAAPLDDALKAWDGRSAKVMQTFKNLPPAEADKLFLSENSPFYPLYETPEYNTLSGITQPALDRWMMRQTTEEDDKLLSRLQVYGLNPATGEGSAWLDVDLRYFQHQAAPSLTPDLRAYLSVRDTYPLFFFRDAGLACDLNEVGEWAVRWENFLKHHKDFAYADKARADFANLLDILMFCVADNTPAFPSWKGRKMQPSWRNGLRSVVREFPGTRVANLLDEYLFALGQNGWKLSPAIEKRFRQRLNDTVNQ